MKKLILASLILLAACGHDQETNLSQWPIVPDLPAELAQKAKKLPPITDDTMGGLVKDGASTDMLYNSVAHQLNSVIDIYTCVKSSLNEKKSPEGCFK